MNVFDPRRATLDLVLQEQALRAGEKTFVTYLADDSRITYRALDDRTARIASGMLAAGLAPRSHVAVLMNNCPEQLLALWGIGRAGMVAVAVNTAAKGELLGYFLGHSDSVALVVEEALLARFADILAACPRIRHVFIVRVARTPASADPAASAAALAAAGVAVHEFAELLDATAREPAQPPRYSDLSMLMYTSGTTGRSKAIMFTHAHLVYWGSEVARQQDYVADDVAYVFLPIFHGNALLSATLPALIAGASIALAPRFSMRSFWSDVRRSGATIFNGLGPVANYLWDAAPSPDDRNHCVNRCHLVPVPEFAAAFQERFGVRITSAFGLTDYCRGTSYDSRCSPEKLGSAGLPIPGVDVRIVDGDDIEASAGAQGEIVLRNNHPWGASLGYYKDPEATLQSRRNLWFHTGDRGSFDGDGYLWYADRIKDSIRRRGENISAFEVEAVIRAHPAVLEAAVFPVSAEDSEDEVAVAIVLQTGADFSPRQLIEHCSANLAHFMVPRYIDFAQSLPMTPSQKVEKYKLRQRAEENLTVLWDREREGIQVRR
ncbi:MAG: AMP-binding protein [Betaproteobacteria bacterium]|nr:AMP-binding protein [Betaproteobacteria bacterium]